MTYDAEGRRTIRLRLDEPVGRSAAALDRWDRWGGEEDRSWVRTLVLAVLVLVAAGGLLYGLKFLGVWGPDECALADTARVQYQQALADHDAAAQREAFSALQRHTSRCDIP